jgi:alkylhydroperoxidase family enzyme
MDSMYLPKVEHQEPKGHYAEAIAGLRALGAPVPQIMHLFAFRPERTAFLQQFTHGVMRGPSPLSASLRELIAAFTSRRNDCRF